MPAAIASTMTTMIEINPRRRLCFCGWPSGDMSTP